MTDDRHQHPVSGHLDRAQLLARLDGLGFVTKTVDHAPVFTVAESAEIEADLNAVIPGAATKNLFLKDKRGQLYLFVVSAHARVDMNELSKRIGSARLSFGRPEVLVEVLGVTPGSVTAFAIANAGPGRVTLLFDKALLAAERINCHPLTNAATTNIKTADLLSFFGAHGHTPVMVDLTAPMAAPPV